MKKKRKKLRLMTALMLGATVFLPTKKALGMVGNTAEDAIRIGTVTHKQTVNQQVLAGETFVNSSLSSAASVVLRHLRGAPVIKDMLVESLQALYVGGVGKVMAHESAFKPDLSGEELGALIKQGLQKISLAQDDPFDTLITKQIYLNPAFGLNDRKDEIHRIIGDKPAIQGLFAEKLSLVMKETPGILNSFLANLPQTEIEKRAQNLCTENFARYFTSLNVVKGWVPTAPTLTYKERQLRDNPSKEYDMQLTKAAEVFGILLQREKTLLKSKPSAESKIASVASSSSSSMPRPELETVSSSSSSSSIHSAPTTFRTAGANETAEIKHSAVYASFSYQNKPGAAYSLIINHRTKDKDSEVRVFNPNTKTYIDLGRLSPSVDFSDQVFNLSSLFASAPSSSSGSSIMRTELNFIDGISDIHSFTIKSGEERLMEVILGDEGSEKQTGVYVYAPELAGKTSRMV
ncbi:hypothetical protein QPK87_03605 [Kamptonema cortianum]|nr:hypothetical protein [Kamptonema cortianum]